MSSKSVYSFARTVSYVGTVQTVYHQGLLGGYALGSGIWGCLTESGWKNVFPTILVQC